MGGICANYIQEQKGEILPLMTSFIPIPQQIRIKTQHQILFDRIKKRLTIIDPRKTSGLSWYESVKYNLYLFGKVERERPVGDCFFYIKDQTNLNGPIIITTNVNQHYVFSPQTLIIYPDDLVYYGMIKNNLTSLPRAEGHGTLFSPLFVYQGEFKNGLPHGFGSYRSKSLQYVGDFKFGEPCGEGLQKSAEQLFVGSVLENGMHKGFKITRKNQKIPIISYTQQNERISLRSHMGV